MYGKFLVEGQKSVAELINSSFQIDTVYATHDWKNHAKAPVELVSQEELRRLSTMSEPDEVIAVALIPAAQKIYRKGGWYIACDGINDPGNAGTILRIADWFGLDGVFFSENSVDIFNPKTVSAAKGSLFRVAYEQVSLKNLFETERPDVFGAVMDGQSIYQENVKPEGVLLLGNEANGISEDMSTYITHQISIPRFGQAESLNVAVAAGILVSEFSRKKL